MADPTGSGFRIFEDDENEVKSFSCLMLYKLRENMYKAHWSTVEDSWLMGRMQDEIAELQEALENGSMLDIMMECADVANFAMMISQNQKEKKNGLV